MKAKAGPSILALIPAWNEAPRVGAVVRGAAVYLPVLVVDDGSEDETAQVAEAAGATVVRHSENRGKGVALMTGFAWAKERSYDAVLTLDADGQHDPEDIPKLVGAYQAGSNPLVDVAIRMREPIQKYLQQASSQPVTFDNAVEGLLNLAELRNGLNGAQ